MLWLNGSRNASTCATLSNCLEWCNAYRVCLVVKGDAIVVYVYVACSNNLTYEATALSASMSV